MPRLGILTALLLTLGQSTFAQSNLPVVKASSRTVHVRDGNHFKKAYWYIMPEKRPDYYFVEIPEKPHKVTFITDSDSITIDTKYGTAFDFIILLNGKDSCYTRISSSYKDLNPLARKTPSASPDTLPFTLGDNDKVYLKGMVNGSEPLDIQFDLGAGGTIIKKSSVEKVNMVFDKTITLHNSDGVHQVPASSANRLEIRNLVWEGIDIAVADNMTDREDLIVGNSLFKNKVVEINYDKQILVVHDTLPNIGSSYSQHDIILDGGTVPFVEGSLTSKGKIRKGWMMFDTGAYTSILNSEDVPKANKMLGEARKMIGLSTAAIAPKLKVGNYEFSEFNYTTAEMKGQDRQAILGNDLLKRFNIILDNRNGYLYLRPNSLTNERYRNPEYYVVRIVAGFLIVLVAALIYWKTRKKDSRTAKARYSR